LGTVLFVFDKKIYADLNNLKNSEEVNVMAKDQLNDKQIQLIDELIKGENSIVQACEMYSIPRATYYYWKKHSAIFNKALQEAIEERQRILKQNMKSKADEYIKLLEEKAKNSKNDNASVSALKTLIDITGINDLPDNEGNKDDSGSKNKLLDMLKGKKKQGE
jgi:hypothetical protein